MLETEIFGQIAEQFCGPPQSQMKSFQHLLSTRPQFKDKILQTDTRHYYDHLPMPQRFNPRHDWDEQFGLHKVTQLSSTNWFDLGGFLCPFPVLTFFPLRLFAFCAHRMSKKIKIKTTSGSGSLFATWEQCEHWELLFFFLQYFAAVQ